MNTLGNNQFDAIEKIIHDEGLRMETLDFHPELDVMIVVLNTKAILQFQLSSFTRLASATNEALNNYEIIANGTGIHWEVLDEDLSLKGFLQESLRKTVGIAA